LLKLVNKRFNLALDENVNTGVDRRKAKMQTRIELPVVDARLQADLENTWHELQLASAAPARRDASVHWTGSDVNAGGNKLGAMNIMWDKLGIAPDSTMRTRGYDADINTLERDEKLQNDITVSADSLFAVTDLNNRPSVHVAIAANEFGRTVQVSTGCTGDRP